MSDFILKSLMSGGATGPRAVAVMNGVCRGLWPVEHCSREQLLGADPKLVGFLTTRTEPTLARVSAGP